MDIIVSTIINPLRIWFVEPVGLRANRCILHKHRKAGNMAAKVAISIAVSFVFVLLEIGKFAIKFS